MYKMLAVLAFSLCLFGCAAPGIRLRAPETGLTVECSGEGWTARDCESCARAYEHIGYTRVSSF